MDSSPTIFPELNELLADFVARVSAILDSNLVGVYLTGSFALGAADSSSDCDFLVVTSDRVTASEESALRVLHAEIPTRDGYWAINLEGAYAPKADIETLEALGRKWLEIDRGHRQMEWMVHCNTLDVRWVLRERSPVLIGPAPRTFACEVPADALRDLMRSQIPTFIPDLLTWASFDTIWTQRYVVEALCRMLYTLDTGEVTSKRAGMEWARQSLAADWVDLIDQVVADRGARWNDPPRPGSVEASKAFAHYATGLALGS